MDRRKPWPKCSAICATRRPLYALYVAYSISLVGNAVAQLAIPWYVLITTALTGLAVFFNFVPIVLAAFFGGVIVDRLGFRTTSVIADLASAAAVAAMPLLQVTVGIEIWQLLGLVFIGALAWASIPLGILLGGLAVETFGVAITLFVIGICYLAVTSFGFFNPAFCEMDRRPKDAAVRDG